LPGPYPEGTTKKSRQIMFSARINAYLDSMKSGERSGLVNAVMERYLDRQEKAIKKARP